MQEPREAIASPDRDVHRLRNGLISTVALAILLLAIALAVPDLRSVLKRIGQVDAGWIVLGVVLELASCIGYLITVRLILNRGPGQEVRWLAWAEMAFGAVVPIGGAGGLAVGAWAMRAWGIGWSRIANRSAVIFLLTSAVNGIVLVIAGLGIGAGVGSDKTGLGYGFLPAVAVALALGFFLLLPRGLARRVPGRHARMVLCRMGGWVKASEETAFTPDWRLIGPFAYLLFDIAVLWACMRATGTHPPLLALIMGYQIGYLANLVPIPGGLGVLDGGLLGALLLYGMPAAPTAAAVILYHTIALWIPTVGGTYGFVRLRRSVMQRGSALVVAPAEQPATRVGEVAA